MVVNTGSAAHSTPEYFENKWKGILTKFQVLFWSYFWKKLHVYSWMQDLRFSLKNSQIFYESHKSSSGSIFPPFPETFKEMHLKFYKTSQFYSSSGKKASWLYNNDNYFLSFWSWVHFPQWHKTFRTVKMVPMNLLNGQKVNSSDDALLN